MLLISTTPQLRKNWLAVTQRHLRLNALHTINLQTSLETFVFGFVEPLPCVAVPREGMAVMAKDSVGVNSLFTLFLFFYANGGYA